MVEIDNKQFEVLVSGGIDAIPPLYKSHLQNVAFIIEDDPTHEQRMQLKLYPNEILFGLYEGVPLPQRGGVTKLLPDKITIFKNPALMISRNLDDLKKHIHHTIWHEVAHYYGLNHDRIHELEGKGKGAAQ
jgi:predicted Zn-dependent protease with MMP-like domain